MKAKIKALTGKIVRLEYKINGYDHSIHGIVGELLDKRFRFFLLSGGSEIKIRFKNVTNIELINKS